ncbi:MAG TPA: BON domain-containing protein [Longimicrobiales bacterium]
MFRNRGGDGNGSVRAALVGAATGLAAGLVLGWRGGAARRHERDLERLEARLRDALRGDEILGRREIEPGALTWGIVELSGSVRDEEEAERAVRIAERVPGVRTVLNRLDIRILEEHLADTRRRGEAGEPALHETHWYGMGVGTGPRRQGERTDPDRPSDKVPMISRELGANRAIEQTSEIVDKLPPGVEGHTTVPAAPSDRGTAAEASHRRLGNVGPEPLQALNPEAGVHREVKKGTELTLEESGLEEELENRGRKDRD